MTVAKVAVLCPDLLFGSKIEGALTKAGHTLAEPGVADVVIADVEAIDPVEAVNAAAGAPTLGFYPHVDVALRDAAQDAGFDRVVPRSRMSREMVELVDWLLEA